MDSMDELSLMKKVRAGDMKAFQELIRPHEQRAFSMALTILGSGPLAKKAVRGIFIETYRTIKRKDICSFRTWLDDRIARSILDVAGKQLQQRMLTDTEGIPYRIIIAFTYYQQFTIPQIASLLNADENVVRTRLYWARMRLLQRHCPPPT
ncbi:hypothetical protein JQN58_19335 [Aneurinibacillus sp. BA2021]|nr:hypothetical protein [Aneurinibacillus sp. BA2021]